MEIAGVGTNKLRVAGNSVAAIARIVSADNQIGVVRPAITVDVQIVVDQIEVARNRYFVITKNIVDHIDIGRSALQRGHI